jgi:hypothetical protein
MGASVSVISKIRFVEKPELNPNGGVSVQRREVLPPDLCYCLEGGDHNGICLSFQATIKVRGERSFDRL